MEFASAGAKPAVNFARVWHWWQDQGAGFERTGTVRTDPMRALAGK